MCKKVLSVLCALALVLGLLPASTLSVGAAQTPGAYQVGFARVDINPYVVEDDPTSGIMALPLGGTGDTWDRLSTYGLLDDNGDGIVDENDGLKVTCIAISDEDGKTILLITGDFMGVYKTTNIRNAIIGRVDAAIASGELTGILPLEPEQIYYAGTHTHSSPASSAYVSGGKTGTNAAGVDLSVVNENLGIWIDRTIEDVADAAMLALKDRAPAQLTKDQLSVSKATSPVLHDKRLNSTRLYRTDVDGDEFVSGDNFNSVYKKYYADPDDYETSRGINPKQVAPVNDTMYLLKFDFGSSDKLPIILTNWRGHVTTVNRDKVPGSTRYAVSSDYVNAYRHALEYGCEVSFDPVNGYITDWTIGSTQKYRVAFFNDTGGSVNTGGFEKIIYHGSEGEVEQRANSWLKESVNTSRLKNKTGSYGTVLATLAQECLNDGLNEIPVSNGKIKTSRVDYYGEVKTTGITALAYAAAKACREAAAVKTVTYPYKYTDPETGEVFAVGSSFHADKIIGSWDSKIGAPETGIKKLTLTSFLLSREVAFLSIPGEPFDFLVKDITVTGEARTAPENNLWNSLIHEDTYGRPFVLGYCNGYQSYFPSYDAYVYNQGSTRWAVGSYEAHQARYQQGTAETVVRIYDKMLRDLAEGSGDLTYTGYCAHCGENQLWQPYNNETTLTTGHYYLLSDVHTTQVKIGGGQTVCLDLKGYTFNGQTRAFYTVKDDCKDVVSIMDSSEAQTGRIQGCGAANGAAVGFYSGTGYIRPGDELNIYSGTVTTFDRTAYSVVNGGVLVVEGTFNMYGGTVEGGTAGSFTGSYYSGGIKTANRTGNGGCIYLTGTLNMYGGTIRGGELMSITGTVTPTETGYTYQEDRTPVAGNGSCIRVTKTGLVNLSGDGQIDQLHFAEGGRLNVTGSYRGAAEIKFDALTELPALTVVGSADTHADTGAANITLADAPGKTVAVKGTELVVSDLPYRYDLCEACGECQWIPMTDADFDALGKNGLNPGHYILTENVTVSQQLLNSDGTKPGTYCVDLAGHTFRGSTRAFLVHEGARLNILDSQGSGYVEGQGSAALWGGSVRVEAGAEIHLYGGTLRHHTGRTETITNGGAVVINGGLFHLHGGTLEGAKATGKGAAVYVTGNGHFIASGGTVKTGTAEVAGPGVYVEKGCFVHLSGNAQIAQLQFAAGSAETLTVDGSYSGSVALRYGTALEAGTVIGIVSPNGDLADASITVADHACQRATGSEGKLTVQFMHTYQTVTVAPTCTEGGYTTHTCSVCTHSFTDDIRPAEGHSYQALKVDATCTADGYTTYTCHCGDTYIADEEAALGHSYETVTVDATCTSDGSVTDTCQNCGDTNVQVLPALGHSYQTVTVDATCTSDGSVTDTCQNCGDTKIQILPAPGHSHKAVITAPTCTDRGFTTYTCHCGDTYMADEVDALGHSYQTVCVDATCTTDGSITLTCNVCGDVKFGTIPALGHSYQGGKCTNCHACEACGECQWIPMTDADFDALGKKGLNPGHYILTEDVTVSQQLLNSDGTKPGTYCVDLAGHTFRGSTRAFLVYEGARLNILDSQGSGYVEGQGSAALWGGSVRAEADAEIHLYGGTLRHHTGRTETITNGGAVAINGGLFHLHGGTLEGAKATGKGAAVYVTGNGRFIASGGTVNAGTAEKGGNCIYIEKNCYVTLSGASVLSQIFFATGSEDTLTVEGTYTGSVELQYASDAFPEDGTVIGSVSAGADLANASITIANNACKIVAVREGQLSVQDRHHFEDGVCTVCGAADPVIRPTLTLKSPTLEFKDMITVNAMFTAENIEDVVEMGMITYKEKVEAVSVDTADHVIPGTTYDVNTGRYIAHSQGIHAKYLGDTVYLACYAKLTDGSYVYTKLAPYSPVQYAASQLKNSSDMKLKQLVAAMLNYGAEAQLFFGHNVENLANAGMTEEQKALPEAYRADMVNAVPNASAEKQGIFANNQGFSKRYPAISFEGAFCINYFFKPNYTPVGDITLYYWKEADFAAADVLTAENASGSMTLALEDSGEYRGDIVGISAKNLSEAVYVAAVYSDGTTTWTSGVLGYSIGAYCSGQSAKGAEVAALAEATAVYGYHAKQYFG